MRAQVGLSVYATNPAVPTQFSLEPTLISELPLDEEQIALNVQALKNRLRGKGRRRGSSRLESGSGRDRDGLAASE